MKGIRFFPSMLRGYRDGREMLINVAVFAYKVYEAHQKEH